MLIFGEIFGAILEALILFFMLFIKFWRTFYVPYKLNKFKKEESTVVTGEIVFAGDSITDMYKLTNHYPCYTIYNRGISGDATFHLLRRIDGICKLKPSVIVLLIGTNDFLNASRNISDIVVDYEKILQHFAKKLPNTAVICESVYPCTDNPKSKIVKWQQDIVKLNVHIKRLAEHYGYTYADIYSGLVDPSAVRINPGYTKDGIHPNEEGYVAITKNLLPYIEAAYKAKKL